MVNSQAVIFFTAVLIPSANCQTNCVTLLHMKRVSFSAWPATTLTYIGSPTVEALQMYRVWWQCCRLDTVEFWAVNSVDIFSSFLLDGYIWIESDAFNCTSQPQCGMLPYCLCFTGPWESSSSVALLEPWPVISITLIIAAEVTVHASVVSWQTLCSGYFPGCPPQSYPPLKMSDWQLSMYW